MKFLPLVWKNLLRRKVRTAFTLLSIVVAFVLFGYLAGQAIGGGVAWLSIVVSGALGNFINALLQDPTHSSIGASRPGSLAWIVSHTIVPTTPSRGITPSTPLRQPA